MRLNDKDDLDEGKKRKRTKDITEKHKRAVAKLDQQIKHLLEDDLHIEFGTF